MHTRRARVGPSIFLVVGTLACGSSPTGPPESILEPVVQAEEVECAVLRAILDDEHHVVETVDHLVGKLVELVDHEGFECGRIHVDTHRDQRNRDRMTGT